MSIPSSIYNTSEHLIVTSNMFVHALRFAATPLDILRTANDILEVLNTTYGTHLGLVFVNRYNDVLPYFILQGQIEEKNQVLALHHPTLNPLPARHYAVCG